MRAAIAAHAAPHAHTPPSCKCPQGLWGHLALPQAALMHAFTPRCWAHAGSLTMHVNRLHDAVYIYALRSRRALQARRRSVVARTTAARRARKTRPECAPARTTAVCSVQAQSHAALCTRTAELEMAWLRGPHGLAACVVGAHCEAGRLTRAACTPRRRAAPA